MFRLRNVNFFNVFNWNVEANDFEIFQTFKNEISITNNDTQIEIFENYYIIENYHITSFSNSRHFIDIFNNNETLKTFSNNRYFIDIFNNNKTLKVFSNNRYFIDIFNSDETLKVFLNNRHFTNIFSNDKKSLKSFRNSRHFMFNSDKKILKNFHQQHHFIIVISNLLNKSVNAKTTHHEMRFEEIRKSVTYLQCWFFSFFLIYFVFLTAYLSCFYWDSNFRRYAAFWYFCYCF